MIFYAPERDKHSVSWLLFHQVLVEGVAAAAGLGVVTFGWFKDEVKIFFHQIII